MLKPSDFTVFPWSSPLKRYETEEVAQNIMIILARTGNVWRELGWDEYVIQRENDGGKPGKEKADFDAVIDYCKSPDTAVLFSYKWKEVAKQGD